MKTGLFSLNSVATLKLIFLIILSIVLMIADHRLNALQSFRSQLSFVLYPIHYLVNLPFEAGRWISDQAHTRHYFQEENKRLESDYLYAQLRLQKYEALEREVMRLRELLNASAKLNQHVVVAELLSVDLDPYKQEILLNKGEQDQVFLGQALIDAHGIMGQIVETTWIHSRAMLITDPSHALPVQSTRSGLRTLAIGTGQAERLQLIHIPTNADVRIGDIFSTSGLGGQFPADFPAAEVVEIELSPGAPFAKVSAKPLANLDKSREVLLIWQEDDLLKTAEPAQQANDDSAVINDLEPESSTP